MMCRCKEEAWLLFGDGLCAVAVVNVPIENGDVIDLFIVVLCISGSDRYVIKNAKPHCVLGRRVMSGRTYRSKSISSVGLHYGINTCDRTAGGEH